MSLSLVVDICFTNPSRISEVNDSAHSIGFDATASLGYCFMASEWVGEIYIVYCYIVYCYIVHWVGSLNKYKFTAIVEQRTRNTYW